MTPDQPSIVVETMQLLPVITGALLAVLGGAITQYLTHLLSGKRERKKLLREKAEALVEILYTYSNWLNEQNSKLVFSKEPYDVPSPLDRAWMIQRLYFPELEKPLARVMAAAVPMVQFNFAQRIAQLKDYNSWVKTFDVSPYQEMYRLYLAEFETALAEVSKVVKTHVES